jgi:PPOX class probable F420-dependent enzyme
VTTPIPIPGSIRMLIDGPNYAHLSTLRADGSPRNWLIWVAREGGNVLVCTNAETPKARDMRRDSRVGLSIAALDNPYRVTTLQGRVIDVRDEATRAQISQR